MPGKLNDPSRFQPLLLPTTNNDPAISSKQSLSLPLQSNSVGTFKNNDYIDLSQHSAGINDLKHFMFQDKNICPDILKIINSGKSSSKMTRILVLDISPNEPSCLNPLNFSNIKLNPNLSLDRIHLNLPTTLVKRPNFKFENLLQATLSKEKISNLLDLFDSTQIFILFDENSRFDKCSKKTYSLIMKFKQYITSRYSSNNSTSKEIMFVSTTSESNPINKKLLPGTGSASTTQKIKKYNLSINIPPIDSSPSKKKMFVQSIKKDTVHYSPVSLYKYFQFNIPENIVKNDPCLPNWLKSYSDKENSNQLLLKLERNFQLLEEFEMERLSTCLVNDSKKIRSNNINNSNTASNDLNTLHVPNNTNTTPLTSSHKIYSLTYLQRQFKQQKSRQSTPTTKRRQVSDTSLDGNVTNSKRPSLKPAYSIPNIPVSNNVFSDDDIDQVKEYGGIRTKDPSPLLIVSTDQISNYGDISPYSASTTSSSDALLTPLDNYEVSQGIQSFSKNRYSNILPYEHSRVKLHYSPLGPPKTSNSDGDFKGFFIPEDSPTMEPNNTNITTNNSNNMSPIKECLPQSTTTKSTQSTNINNKIAKNAMRTRPMLLHSSSSSYARTTNRADNTFNDYFNANYLNIPQINNDYKYVATQAPLISTIDDFWNVVLSNNIKVIVSLNSEGELEMRKWDIYWNNKNNAKHLVKVIATFNNVCNLKGCILRVFQVFKVDKQRSSILFQVQYTQWLDSCTIDIRELLQIFELKDRLISNPIDCLQNILKTKTYQNTDEVQLDLGKLKDKLSNSMNYSRFCNSETPLLIHCSAGCGRTGVFIALDFLIKILTKDTNNSNRIDVWNIKNDLIFIIINELRKQRLSMVQNLSQYITCYESLLKYFSLIKTHEI